MTYKTATKSSIKKDYIEILQNLYEFYTEGSRPLELANLAADKALAGKMKLEGAAWHQALLAHGIDSKRVTLKTLAGLPA